MLGKAIFAYFLPDVLYFDISVSFCDPISYCITKEIFAITRESKGGSNSNPLQYSCLENPMDGGAW